MGNQPDDDKTQKMRAVFPDDVKLPNFGTVLIEGVERAFKIAKEHLSEADLAPAYLSYGELWRDIYNNSTSLCRLTI